MDNSENFVYKTTGGYEIVQALTHEMGHALGLKHTDVKGAIMYPWQQYGSYRKLLRLHDDDIKGLQHLYGKKPEPPLKNCPRNSLTAVFYHKNYKFYVAITNNQQMYFFFKNGRIRAGPMPVEKFFPKAKIPERINAAFSTDKLHPRKHLTVIFAGASYYLYDRFKFFSGPHSIHSRYEKDGTTKTPLEIVLPDWVPKVEAAFTWHNGDTYIFYNRYYWRYGYEEKRFRRGYPRMTSTHWKGFPNRIHTAFAMHDGKYVLMVNNKVYQLEGETKVVAKGFPLHIGKGDFPKCK